MSLKKAITLLLGIFTSQVVSAEIPVEVISSCKNAKAANSSVTFTKLISPAGLGDDKPGCLNHSESKEDKVTLGAIICNDENFLIINKSLIDLKTAQNHSINPAIKPGADISPTSEWFKIVFNNQKYICIDVPLSSSGDGANISQYYIIENAFSSSKPILHYYFFNQDVMPLTSTD